MIHATPLERYPLAKLEKAYGEFAACATTKYRWDDPPVDFETLQAAFQQRLISGIVVEDTGEPEPIGFMLYRIEEHRAIEINIIYMRDGVEPKAFLSPLMERFLEIVKPLPGWDVVSYPMLGAQEAFIRTLTWYGFKPMGQAILEFKIMDPINLQILKQQELPPLPEGYRLDEWQPFYAGETAQSIFDAFSNAADALWDPRFRSLLGAKQVVANITQGLMGKHIPQCTTVLLKDDVPVGFCFLVQASMNQGNVPLVGLRPSEKGKKLGNHLLKATLDKCIQSILEGKIGMYEITATMETDNFPAIAMYRRFGFRETYNYPHAYLTREAAQAWKPGQWC